MSARHGQLALDFEAPAFALAAEVAPTLPHSGTPTSAAAAKSMRSHAAAQRLAVLAFIRDAGAEGATDEEVQRWTGIAGNSVRPRRGELEKSGDVVRTDRTRPSAAGRACTVFVAREVARA